MKNYFFNQKWLKKLNHPILYKDFNYFYDFNIDLKFISC